MALAMVRAHAMILEILPDRTGGAAENMAADFMLLQRHPVQENAKFRHYGWRSAAFTFGYSQKISLVRGQLPQGESFDLCRRPTGGGIVDHRDDWTYALVIPRGHPLEELRASQSYRAVHEALAQSLAAAGAPVSLKAVAEPRGEDEPPGPAGVCFERAEVYDVVNTATGAKIAGGAQKRNKRGLLFQGSIWRPAVGADLDWSLFRDDFAARVAGALALAGQERPWPDFNEDEMDGLVEKYSSAEWMEFR